MPVIKVEVEQKRPLDATPERALAMVNIGMSQKEIAKLWGISAGRVSHLVNKARKQVILSKARQNASLARAQQIAAENQNAIDTLVER